MFIAWCVIKYRHGFTFIVLDIISHSFSTTQTKVRGIHKEGSTSDGWLVSFDKIKVMYNGPLIQFCQYLEAKRLRDLLLLWCSVLNCCGHLKIACTSKSAAPSVSLFLSLCLFLSLSVYVIVKLYCFLLQFSFPVLLPMKFQLQIMLLKFICWTVLACFLFCPNHLIVLSCEYVCICLSAFIVHHAFVCFLESNITSHTKVSRRPQRVNLCLAQTKSYEVGAFLTSSLGRCGWCHAP